MGATEGIGEKGIDKSAAEHPAEYEKRLAELERAARLTGGGSVHLQKQRALQRVQRIMNDPAKRPLPPPTTKPQAAERDALEKGAAKGRMARPADPAAVVELRPAAEEAIGSRSTKEQEKSTPQEKQPLPGALGRAKNGRFTRPLVPIEKPGIEKPVAEKSTAEKSTAEKSSLEKVGEGKIGEPGTVRLEAKPLPPAAKQEKVPLVLVEAIADPVQQKTASLIATDTFNGRPRLRISDVQEATRALQEIAAGATEFSNPEMVKKIQANPRAITAQTVGALEAKMMDSPAALASRGKVNLPNGKIVDTVFEMKLPDGKLAADPVSEDGSPAAPIAAAPATPISNMIDLAPENRLNESKFIPRALQDAIKQYDSRRKNSGYARIYLQAESEIPGKPGKIYVVAADGVEGVRLGMRMPIEDKVGARVIAYADSNNSVSKAAMSVAHDTVNAFAGLLSKVIGRKFSVSGSLTEATIMEAEEKAEKDIEANTSAGAIGVRLAALGGAASTTYLALRNSFALIAHQVMTFAHSSGGKATAGAIAAVIARAAYVRVKEAVLARRNQSLKGFIEEAGVTVHANVRVTQ